VWTRVSDPCAGLQTRLHTFQTESTNSAMTNKSHS